LQTKTKSPARPTVALLVYQRTKHSESSTTTTSYFSIIGSRTLFARADESKFYEGELWKREMESNPSRTPTPSLYVASRISKKWTQDFHSDFGACRLESAVSELNV
jgi:hypothetical protein